jgi:hypothetical protein
MFVAIETQLHTSLVENAELHFNEESTIYVCERLSSYSEENRKALVSRMPPDVRALADGQGLRAPRLGALELDFIDFLLHYKQNRLLSVVGNVGVGKTTFIRYVLEHLRAECPSLGHFVPLVLNCLAIGTNSPSYRDLLYELFRAIKRHQVTSTKAGKSGEHILNLSIDEAQSEVGSLGGGDLSSSQFLHFLKQLRASAIGLEPIIVFDNLDQLDPDAVSKICTLGRAVYLTTQLCVVTAMRPATYRTQVERDFEKSAMPRFSVDIEPPDLRAVIRSRLGKALKERTSLRMSTGPFVLTVDDIEESLNSLSDKVLTPRNQEVFLRDICGDNVRKALVSFEYFLRYRDLKFQLLFATKSSVEPTEELHGTWFDHFLDGLMVGDREFYQDGSSPISNILVFQWNGRDDFLILYWCLSLLNWAGRYTKASELASWTHKLGYEDDMVLAALEHLLHRRLVYCPSREGRLECRSEVMLSRSGAYYLDRLLRNPQYIYQAVYDVPLPHAKWKDSAGDSFPVRMNSILELLHTVFEVEAEQILLLCADAEASFEALSAVNQARTFARKMLESVNDLVQRSRRARFERVREAAEEFTVPVGLFEEKIRDIEERISSELTRRRWLPDSIVKNRTVEREIGPRNDLIMVAPTSIGPALKNHVQLKVDLRGTDEATPLVAFWQATDQEHRYQEIAELKKTAEEGRYQGDFVITGVKTLSAFPSSKVTVFSASRPVFVATIGSHSGSSFA